MDDNSEKLRAKAKEELRQGKIIDTSLYETDMKILVEELSIYQIELEHQNQELMLSQEHLQQSNDRYLDLFDNAPVGYLIVDSTGIIKDINQTACKLLECSKTEFIDTKISKIIHPDYQDIYFLYFRTLIHQKHQQPCDIKLRKANNSFFYGRIQGICQTHEIDREAEFRLAISDITIQKELEIKLLAAKEQTEQSEERFQMLFNKAPLGYQSLDINGYFIEVNQQWLDTLGYERDEVIGKWFGDFLTPMYQDGFRERFPIFKAQGHIHSEFEMVHKNGSILFIAFDGKIGNDANGNFMQTHCILQDITETKRVKEALLDAEWKFKALFELGPIGVAYHRMIYDEAGAPIDYYFIDANASYNELTGVSPKGMTVREAFPGIENDPFDWIGKFGHVAKTGETIRFEQFLETNQRWYDCVGYQYKPDHFVAAFSEITKRKEAEIALKESELRFKVLFDDAPDAMFLADPASGKIVDANNAAALLFKKQKQELVGLFQYELHPPKAIDMSKSTFKTQFEEKKETSKNIPVENSILCSDGTEIPVEIVGQAIQIGDKSLMLGTFRNITKRKEAENALKESELRFKILFDDAPDAMFLADPASGKIVDANNAAALLFKKQKQELVGLLQHELHPPKAIDMSKSTFKTQFEEKKETSKNIPVENSILCSDGTEIPVEIVGQAIQIGDKSLMLGTFRNITERKKAEEALKQSEEKFAVAFKTSPYAITITRPEDGKFIEVNDAFFSMTGYSPEEALNSTSIGMDLWFDAEDRNNVLKGLRTGGTINGLEFHFKKKNGEIITGLFSAHLIDIKNKTYILSNINDITERKIIENELNKHKEQFEDLYENAPIGYHEIDNEGRFVRINKTELDMLGYNSDEVLGRHIWEFINDQTLSKSATKSKLSGHEISTLPYEREFIHKNGNLIPILLKDKVIKDASGLIIGNRSTIQDITERKQAEQALINSEEKYRSLLENSGLGVGVYSPEGKVILFNQKALENMAGKAEDYIGKSLFEIFDEQSATVYYNRIQETIGSEQALEYEDFVPLPSGDYWFISNFTKIKNDIGEVIAVQIISHDISVRKHAEQALKESEEKLSTLFNSMTEMVVMHELVFDENGDAIDYRILDCNKTFTSITGIEKESAVGRLATEIFGTETAPYLQEYANVALNGTTIEFNTYYPPLDKYFLISVVSTEKNKFSTTSTDITSNEQIHEIIKEKNKELENYIYVASHDLRSPLVNIQGFSKRLQKQTAELTNLMAKMNANAELAAEYKRLTTDDIPKSLSFILNNVSKMDTLINGLLQVSRTGRVVMSPTILEMNKLFKSILTIFDYQLKEMEANVVLHELDSCYGDTNQLNQLFSNIIGNALKYSDKNRKLTLEISSHTKYNKVIYSIKDNGIGINNRHLQKIWDVFYRVDASAPEAGEGLGLSLAKRIVDKHKGKIWAESVEGEGSTFFVELHKNKFEE